MSLVKLTKYTSRGLASRLQFLKEESRCAQLLHSNEIGLLGRGYVYLCLPCLRFELWLLSKSNEFSVSEKTRCVSLYITAYNSTTRSLKLGQTCYFYREK